MFKITFSKVFGRCVTSTKLIKKGTIIELCEVLVLSVKDTPKVNATDLKYYTFKYSENQDCLVLGSGEIFNHDANPNVAYALIKRGNRKLMQFKATRDIRLGEQMFINYEADTKVNAKKYVNKNLTGV